MAPESRKGSEARLASRLELTVRGGHAEMRKTRGEVEFACANIVGLSGCAD